MEEQNKDVNTNANNVDNSQHDDNLTPVKVAKWAHAKGIVDKDQVDAMEQFSEGKMDYATMRSLCG